jgi:anti-anti-sigma regulatory factor
MIDRHSIHLLESPWTVLDFIVILVVVAVAVGYSLIAASGVGILLVMALFIREQLSSTVIRRKMSSSSRFSKWVRLNDEMEILEKNGHKSIIFELQGSLFFGTKDQLYTALEPELSKRTYVVLDMRRVQSVDVTAVYLLRQIRDALAERGAFLIFSNLSHVLPNGRNIAELFDKMELTTMTEHTKVFRELDDAVEWIEDQILGQGPEDPATVKPLALKDLEVFKGHKEETLNDLEACLDRRSVAKDEKVYSFGDPGNELYFISKGAVRITLPLVGDEAGLHSLTYGRGDFFGGMAFLSQTTRFNDATAAEDTELFVLKREEVREAARGTPAAGLYAGRGAGQGSCSASALRRSGTYCNAGYGVTPLSQRNQRGGSGFLPSRLFLSHVEDCREVGYPFPDSCRAVQASVGGGKAMFKHILLPTDGSQLARDTAVQAVAFAKEAGAKNNRAVCPPGREFRELRGSDRAGRAGSSGRGNGCQGPRVSWLHQETL